MGATSWTLPPIQNCQRQGEVLPFAEAQYSQMMGWTILEKQTNRFLHELIRSPLTSLSSFVKRRVWNSFNLSAPRVEILRATIYGGTVVAYSLF